MAWPHLDGMVKIVVTYGFDGEPSINVHFVLQRTPVSPVPSAILEAAADAMWSALDVEWKATMGDGWTIDNIHATDWSQEDGEQLITTEALPITGTEVTEETPASNCLVVSHRTDRTGRSRRGRTYLPGLTEGHVAGNHVDGGTAVLAVDVFDAFDVDLALSDLDHVVYSLVADGVPRVTPIATLVTSRIANTRVDTQRRRLPS